MGRLSWRLAQCSQKCPLRENVKKRGGRNIIVETEVKIGRCYTAGCEDEGGGNESRNADAL